MNLKLPLYILASYSLQHFKWTNLYSSRVPVFLEYFYLCLYLLSTCISSACLFLHLTQVLCSQASTLTRRLSFSPITPTPPPVRYSPILTDTHPNTHRMQKNFSNFHLMLLFFIRFMLLHALISEKQVELFKQIYEACSVIFKGLQKKKQFLFLAFFKWSFPSEQFGSHFKGDQYHISTIFSACSSDLVFFVKKNLFVIRFLVAGLRLQRQRMLSLSRLIRRLQRKCKRGEREGRDCKGLNFSSLEELHHHGGQLGSVGNMLPTVGGVGSAVSQAVLHLNQA